MAKNETRVQNVELEQGMTDGTYKSLSPDRGGAVEPATRQARANLDPGWYGMAELPLPARHLPDGSA